MDSRSPISRSIAPLSIFILILCSLGLAADEAGLTIEQVAGRFGLSEGPHWDYKNQKLYFVDIFAQKIHKLDPATGSVSSTYIENGPVGVAIPVEGTPDKFVAGSGRDFVLITWNGESNVTKSAAQVLAKVDQDRNTTRWNDGKVDSTGRFWGGTMGPENNGNVELNQGTLYTISSDLKPKVKVTPVSISNGLAWSLDDTKFYYIDSPTRQVVSYDFDAASGEISNKKTVFDLEKNNVTGLPDGMTIDADGHLWVALYMGHSVIKINPNTSELLQTVRMPADRVTSVAFGGPNFDILYVTTSSLGLSEEELKEQPLAGYVFAVKGLGVRGLPANSFKLNA